MSTVTLIALYHDAPASQRAIVDLAAEVVDEAQRKQLWPERVVVTSPGHIPYARSADQIRSASFEDERRVVNG